MVVREKAEKEEERMKSEGETKDARMARVLNPAMINPDLISTKEVGEDFEDRRILTLDFKLWYNNDWNLNRTYFEKSRKSQLMIAEVQW